MGGLSNKLFARCLETPSAEPTLSSVPSVVRSKTVLVKSHLDNPQGISLNRSITADFNSKLVNDVKELDSKDETKTSSVLEQAQRILKQYRSSRHEELRVQLGQLNIQEDANTGEIEASREPVLMADYSIYIGCWDKSGKRSGFGLAYLPDGSIYEGQWLMNLPSGEGRLIFSSCDYFEGTFELGLISGRGRLTRSDGSFYEGEWVNSLPHGIGREEWLDGQFYEGEYRQGKKHGVGRFLWETSSYYEGEFFENFIQGQGVCKWSNGRKYSGEWKQNLMHGYGRFETDDGRSYEGEYNEGTKHGHGVYTWASGKRYDGGWVKGQQHGVGWIYDPGSSEGRKGIWEHGRRVTWVEISD